MRSTLLTLCALLAALLPGTEHMPGTLKREDPMQGGEVGALRQDETQPLANAGAGAPIYGEAISRTQTVVNEAGSIPAYGEMLTRGITVVNEAGSIPEYGEMLTRGITVVNEAGSIPAYGEMLTRGITVVNEAGSIPEYGEMISRAMTVCNEAGGPPGCPLDCLADSDCDDANVCTEDTCVANLCAHAPIANACDDGDFCTVGDACSGGKCVGDANPECCSPAQFTEHVISTTAFGAVSVFATDVDGDGDIDVLSASRDDDKIAWYENDGALPPTFEEHVISTTPGLAFSVYATDVDGDGDTDVLSALRGVDRIAWYENDGGSPPTFTERVISTNADGARSVFAQDMDGDGDTDVLSASKNDDKIAWYANDGGLPPSFTEHVITTAADLTSSVFAADVNGDGNVDVLSASRNDNKIAWYESDGGLLPTFTERVISTTAFDAFAVFATDVDGDMDIDVLSASRFDNKIAWYENDGGSPPTFTERVISTTAFDAISVFAADVDGDGDTDVLSASQFDDKIAWYENDGGSPPTFTERVISTAASEAVSVFATDLDGDGDIDILSASQLDGKIAWYENTPVSCCTPSWDVTIGDPGVAGGGHVRSLFGVSNQVSVETGLYVGGAISVVGGVDAVGIARWDGITWSPLLHNGDPAANGVNLPAVAMAIFNDELYVGGEFAIAGGQAANHIARWDGSAWRPVLHNNDPSFNGLEGEVWSLVVFDDGTGPALYAAGKFLGGGTGCPNGPNCVPLPLDRIAKWDGNAWSDVGGGSSLPFATSMAVFDDGSGAALFVGGSQSLMKWDGSTWTTVNPFLSIPNSTAEIRSLVVFDDGNGPALFVAGIFTKAGALELNYVARWDGSEWSDLAGGLDSWVFELGVFDDGTGANLYAGGFFSGTADGSVAASRMAKWDGTSWSPLGAGVNGSVWALESFDDGAGDGPDLFVGGTFSQAGGEIARGIAKWTGCPPCEGIEDCGDGCCAAGETMSTCPQDCECDIAPGEDCFEVLGFNSAIDFRDFPIPPDKFRFGAGAPAFDGIVRLHDSSAESVTLSWDRSDLANACTGESIPIQLAEDIVLDEVNAFLVRDESNFPHFWTMTVILSPTASPPGTMSITRTHDNGGTFTAEFSVNAEVRLSPSFQPPLPEAPIIESFDLRAEGFGPFRLRTVGPVSFVDTWDQAPPGAPCDVNFNPGVEEDPATGIQCCETFLVAGSGLYLEMRQPGCIDACATGACCITNIPDEAAQCDDTIDEGACDDLNDPNDPDAPVATWQPTWPDCDDADGDGLANWLETVRPRLAEEPCHTETDPNDPDTDNDGCPDGTDPDPLDPCVPPGGCPGENDYTDCDNNLEPDACDVVVDETSDCNNNQQHDACELVPVAGACCLGTNACVEPETTKADCASLANSRFFCGSCPEQNVRSASHQGRDIVHFTNRPTECFPDGRAGTGDCAAREFFFDTWIKTPEEIMCHLFGIDDAPPIPADFFCPDADPTCGSNPFVGQICLDGVPLGATEFGDFAEADTLIKRFGDPFDRCEAPEAFPTPAEQVDIEIVALSLESTSPITVTFTGGQSDEEWDVTVDLSPNGLLPETPPSTLTAIKTHCNGGTYESILHVQPRFTFTRRGGPEVRVLDTWELGWDAQVLVQEDTSAWTHDVFLNLATDPCTTFQPGVEDTEPVFVCDCNGTGIRDVCDIESGASFDCNVDGIPDDCQLADNDCNTNGIPDECEADCNLNGEPDDCDVNPTDPDGNGLVSDDCDAGNGNGAPDECEGDCNDNGVADSCDIARGSSNDVDGNGVPDECQDVPAGRCCVFGGTCLVVSEDECLAIGGSYGGDATSCAGDSDGNGDDDACPGTCCRDIDLDMHPDTCQSDTSGLDCAAAGGSFVEAGAVCSGILGACCLDWDGDGHHDLCVDNVAEECCLIQGGWFMPGGNCSGIIGACCLDVDGDGHHDTCTDGVDQDCCTLEGGWFTPDVTCSGIIGACCLDWDGDGTLDICAEMDEDCCIAEDGTFLGVGSVCAGDGDGDGVDDACEIDAPIRAAAPHDILKNRYISIDPRGANGNNPPNLHIRVEVDSTEVNGLMGSGPWWANEPVNGGGLSPAVCISVVTTTEPAAEPDWTGCDTVHLTGCAIVPTTTYAITAESRGVLSTVILLDTQAKPGVKWHGDTVGFFDGMIWTPPNGTTSIDDAVAAIKTFQDPNAFNATHLSVSDVHPNLDGTEPNLIVSIADVFVIILGFQGQEYPGPDLTQCP